MDNHPQASQDAPLNVDSSFPSPYRTAQEVDIEPTSAVEAPSTEVPSTETVEVPAAATVAKPGPFAGLPMRIQEALTKRGFTDLTPVQRAVVAAGVANRQLQISSQTGSGKTVALGIVLADHLEKHEQNTRGPEALIIVPTRELANQVCEELGWLLAGYPGSRRPQSRHWRPTGSCWRRRPSTAPPPEPQPASYPGDISFPEPPRSRSSYYPIDLQGDG